VGGTKWVQVATMRCGTISNRLVSKVIEGAASAKLMDLFKHTNFEFLQGNWLFMIVSLVLSATGLISIAASMVIVPASVASGDGGEGPRQDWAKSGNPSG